MTLRFPVAAEWVWVKVSPSHCILRRLPRVSLLLFKTSRKLRKAWSESEYDFSVEGEAAYFLRDSSDYKT